MTTCATCQGTGFELVEKDGGEFARPCSCRATDRVAGRDFVRDCRIPPRFREAALATYVAEVGDRSLSQVLELCLGYCRGYPYADSPDEGLGLLFSGDNGVGKTHLAVAVLRELYEQKGVRGQFWDFHGLIREIRRSYDPETRMSEFRVLEPVIEAEVLLLDDLGALKISDWMHDTLFYILNSRYLAKRANIITTNYEDIDPAEARRAHDYEPGPDGRPVRGKLIFREYLVERIGNGLRSRLMEMCHLIRMQGQDRRNWAQASTLRAIRRAGASGAR